jgi:hypothetical protein
VSGFQFDIVMLDRYFDLDNFDNPIGEFITEKYTYEVASDFTKKSFIYVKENEIELMDSFLQFGGPKKDKFYSISGQTVDLALYSENYIFTYLVLDSSITTYKRTVFSLLDAVAQLGGVFGVLNSALTAIIGYYAGKKLDYSILKKCYQYENSSGNIPDEMNDDDNNDNQDFKNTP